MFEFGGGLGDVLRQLYDRNVYNVLWNLGPNDRATVWLVCLNPYAHELFTQLPTAERITLKAVGYWGPNENDEMRRKHGMPLLGSNRFVPSASGPINFPLTAEDRQVLSVLRPGYIVLCAGAGTPDRTFPEALLRQVVADFKEQEPERQLVLIGRNFERQGRQEPRVLADGQVVDLVDQLTVPGAAQAVKECSGLITAHSALNLLGWLEHKAQLLLYPQNVLDHHAPKGRYDAWMFGASWSSTVHGLFGDYQRDWMSRFRKEVR